MADGYVKGFVIRVYRVADGRDMGYMSGGSVGEDAAAPLFFIHRQAADDVVRNNTDRETYYGVVRPIDVPANLLRRAGHMETGEFFDLPNGMA